MVKYEFIYMNNHYTIDNSDYNNNILQQYTSLINQDINQLIFLYCSKKSSGTFSFSLYL